MNPEEIHTIVTDLDGTLLNDNSMISDFNKKVLEKAIQNGIQFIIATGRRYFSTNRFASEFSVPLDLICNNGQVLRTSMNGSRILSHYIPEQTTKSIIQLGKQFGFIPIMHVDQYEEGIDMITEFHEEHSTLKKYVGGAVNRSLSIPNVLHHSLPVTTVICFLHNDYQRLVDFEKKYREDISNYRLKSIITTIHKIGPCMELILDGVSKWSGVMEYMKMRNKTLDGIIAFGDEANDIELIQNASIGVAMKNGVDSVKQIAKKISDYTNDEDGVGKTLLDLGVVQI
jgi:Cof subfamily protein (haloacid dehalogenase superfamily)